jgi:hypothetical protein
MLLVYYLSLAFQAVYNNSATIAGVKLLPLIMTQIVILIGSSRVIAKIGRFKYPIVMGPVFLLAGSGALYSIKYGTPENHLYGFEVLLGIGIGLAMQNSMLAVQFELKAEPWLIPAGTGISIFSKFSFSEFKFVADSVVGFAGRIVGLSIGGSVFGNTIQTNIAKYAPDLPPQYAEALINDASAVWTLIPEQYREASLIAYTEALRNVYIVGVPYAILALVGALAIKNSKMQSKAEEEEANRLMREKAAASQGDRASEKTVTDGTQAQKEEDIAIGTAMAGVEPQVMGDQSVKEDHERRTDKA